MVWNVYTGAYGPIKKVYTDEKGTTRYDVEFDSELGPQKIPARVIHKGLKASDISISKVSK